MYVFSKSLFLNLILPPHKTITFYKVQIKIRLKIARIFPAEAFWDILFFSSTALILRNRTVLKILPIIFFLKFRPLEWNNLSSCWKDTLWGRRQSRYIKPSASTFFQKWKLSLMLLTPLLDHILPIMVCSFWQSLINVLSQLNSKVWSYWDFFWETWQPLATIVCIMPASLYSSQPISSSNISQHQTPTIRQLQKFNNNTSGNCSNVSNVATLHKKAWRQFEKCFTVPPCWHTK